MEKLIEQVKKELKEIQDKGLSASNLDLATKLTELQKELYEVQKLERGGSEDMYGSRYNDGYNVKFYRDGGGYNDGGYNDDYGRRGRNGRYMNPMRDQMARMMDGMEQYEYGRDRYMHGGDENRIYDGLEKLMYAMCMFAESAMEFAETPQEKEIIRKHLQKMSKL